jgi:hypothetical protein
VNPPLFFLSSGFSAAGVFAGESARVRRRDRPLVESQDIGIIEVDEATLDEINRRLQFIGIDEAELMTSTNATFNNAFSRVARVLLVWFDPLCDSTIEKRPAK